jgi:predicted ATPase with chaperone activity
MNFLLTETEEKSAEKHGPEHRPRSIAETGVRASILEDLALKSLYLSGPFSVAELGKLTHLSYEGAFELFDRLRAKMLCEVTGMHGHLPNLAITSMGRTRAMELLSQSQYSGSAPVSLKSYVEQVRKQSVRNVRVTREEIERGFSNFVLDEKTLSQFGTALNSGEAIFLYGPPGTGKTSAAEALAGVLAHDAVWVPYAVEVDGQVIVIHDPTVHKPFVSGTDLQHDRRWVHCHRPTVIAGGELTMEMLDLQFSPSTNYYVGPAQLKANNGTLIIDDFGRQRITPEELLNRWVVPLDRGIEFLTLAGGRKIEVPFELLVVFASNKDPMKLMDPAFLRRIQTKIRIGAVTPQQFLEIFRRVAQTHGVDVDDDTVYGLIAVIRDELKEELRACHPRDLINQVAWAARFDEKLLELDRASLMKAVESYFLARS